MNTKNPHQKLGQRIKRVIGLTNELQKKIASKAGCQPTEISRWIRGEVAPNYTKLASIGRACNLDTAGMGWLFDGKGKAPDYPGYGEEASTELLTSGKEGKNTKHSKSSGKQDPINAPLNEDGMIEIIKGKDETIAVLRELNDHMRDKIKSLEEELLGKQRAGKKQGNGS